MAKKDKERKIPVSKILLIVLAIEILLLACTAMRYIESRPIQDNGTLQSENTPLFITAPTATPSATMEPEPASTPYPKPTRIPILRPYEIDNSHDIWRAKDPSSYITPNNEWVRYYASQLFVDYDGRIKHKNERVPWFLDEKGNIVLWTYKPFVNNYVYDWEQFGTGSQGSLANDDYWANADYYLTHEMKGDCDEWMNAVTSMMLSGEMSIWQDGKLVKQVISAKAVLGYIGNERDGWVEYQVYNKDWITSTSRKKDGYGEYHSATMFITKEEGKEQIKPVFEFTDKYFREVE